MSQLDAALETALAGDSVTVFAALRIVLPSATLRLLDGSAEIDIGAETFTGDHALATLGSVANFEDGTGDEVPPLRVVLLPTSDTAAAVLTDSGVQGSAVTLMIGARDDSTGLVIGEPYVLFAGEIDVPLHRFGRSELSVEYMCAGAMGRMFFEDEGIRLAPSWHEQVWPGETGFDHVTGVTDNIYWGGVSDRGGGVASILFGALGGLFG